MQKFKENDATESVMTAILMPSLDDVGIAHDDFFADCFNNYFFGDVLYALDRDPMVGVITQEVYRTSFPAIHELFTAPGTFEFYLSVFRKIFSDSVDVEFTIPGPGQLAIDVNALTLDSFNLMTREIVGDVYVYSRLVTSDLNEPILGHGTKGIKTQSEIEGLLSEISAYGVFTTIELETP